MSRESQTATINLSTAEFVKEAHLLSEMPADFGAEIVFAGRSNAGKSSVINAFCNRKKLARTSRTPGRTQQFVVFEFAPGRRFIDLPGFGYAKVSKSKRLHWEYEIPRYFESRRSLIGLVLVVDSRHSLKEQEIEILRSCKAVNLPTLLLLNKCDKLNQRETAATLRNLRGSLQEFDDLVIPLLFSATARRGIDEALVTISNWYRGADNAGK
ncbi:MAG: GTP-binding protein [Gammaproteobacteria bacterium]|jgi:GTP-binding protein